MYTYEDGNLRSYSNPNKQVFADPCKMGFLSLEQHLPLLSLRFTKHKHNIDINNF